MSTISIIGSGRMAAAIGGRTAKAKHAVEVVSRDPAKARALADQLASGATIGAYGAAPPGDIVILAVPYTSAAAVVANFGEALDGKVIIDITNPVAPDLSGLVTPHGSSGAQETAKGLPAGAHVVKAFNTIFGHVLAKGGRLDAFIAADDAEAKAQRLDLPQKSRAASV
jgi:predicted dinucleotide-binding enzyme